MQTSWRTTQTDQRDEHNARKKSETLFLSGDTMDTSDTLALATHTKEMTATAVCRSLHCKSAALLVKGGL